MAILSLLLFLPQATADFTIPKLHKVCADLVVFYLHLVKLFSSRSFLANYHLSALNFSDLIYGRLAGAIKTRADRETFDSRLASARHTMEPTIHTTNGVDGATTPLDSSVDLSPQPPIAAKLETHGGSKSETLGDARVEKPFQHTVKNHPLEFKIDTLHDDDDPWPIEWIMLNVLNAYLQPDTELSVDAAAQCLDSILPGNRPDSPNEKKETNESFMVEISDLIWKIANQIPPDHESQDKLVNLLHTLKRLPISVTTTDSNNDHVVCPWRAFSGWDDSYRHALAIYPKKYHHQPGKTAEQVGNEYINAQAFAARLQATKFMSPKYYTAMGGVMEAVEQSAAQAWLRQEPEYRVYYIIAGCLWMVHAGEWFWSEIRWGECIFIKKDRLPFPPSRWVAWMRAFQRIDTEDPDARYWAGRAATKMEEIMLSHGYDAELMEGWMPESKKQYFQMREDPRYTHLFQITSKSGESQSDRKGRIQSVS